MSAPIRIDTAPEPRPREPKLQCSRSCCWTPFGHRPRLGCHCHPKEDPK